MRIVITGGNSGIGRATAAALAAAGHDVVIACRTIGKAHEAASTMNGSVSVSELDLADLASVRRFADTIDYVDVLVNNAGVLGLPLTRTADGFEAHMGINHLGHFALTCLLGDRIRDRVVSVSSSSYALARMRFDDLNWRTREYNSMKAYGESKLAIILFMRELSLRGTTAYASEPGMTDTNITRDGRPALQWAGRVLAPRLGQSASDGARSTIQAVTSDLPSGTYLAPRGLLHLWGRPRPTRLRAKAVDRATARRLWELSEDLTGCRWHREQ